MSPTSCQTRPTSECVIIIADDLTGAADAAAAWARVAPIAVLFGHEALAGAIDSAVAIDTDSRHVTAAQASQRVARAMAVAAEHDAPIYKKIDSTLRGNTASEIISALTAHRLSRDASAAGLGFARLVFPRYRPNGAGWRRAPPRPTPHAYPGYTELLAALTDTPEVSMMLTAPGLRVIHVTTHIGLIDAIETIEPGLVERTIRRGHDALLRSGIEHPRIAVCGINPHAGEYGLFGHRKEAEKIVPAVRSSQSDGIDVAGPLPADTLFYRAIRGDFDLVVAMYHDQGHGPVKALGLEAGVNITIGLPVIRTSVDHGTAFDIAGSGKADHASLLEALREAIELAPPAAE